MTQGGEDAPQVYPDGRGMIHQPLRLLRALAVVKQYFEEQTGG